MKLCVLPESRSDEGRGAESHGDLHGARHGNPSHGLQGKTGCLGVVLRIASGVCVILDLHAVKEENAPAKPVMATGIFFIAIKTEAQTAPFRHLIRGEGPLVALTAALLGGLRRGRERQRLLGRRKRWPGRGSGQEAARGHPRGRLHRAVGLHQFHLARQAHGGRERLRVVDADGVAERRQESAGEELDALSLIKTARAR
jgi:hypothetical protein